jgi:hypothetical protein
METSQKEAIARKEKEDRWSCCGQRGGQETEKHVMQLPWQ